MSATTRIHVKIAQVPGDKDAAAVAAFFQRPAFDPKAETVARETLATVRARGDDAVAECAAKFDGFTLPPDQWRVTQTELNDARLNVDAGFVLAVRETHKRVTAFAKAGLKKDWTISSPRGGTLGEQFMPLDRVGIYVPGGAAPLVSTVLMTVPLARVAGVPEVVVCTPAGHSGKLNPFLLVALELAGATEIFKIGGIQAIGALAYGTPTIRKVRKIVGPGGQYVTAAKKCVYGDVALDLVAGPSEIAILADESAAPEFVAADLLSQAEHGTGHEKALLVTNSGSLAKAVQAELIRQAESLSRKDSVIRVLNEGALLIVVNHLDAGMELCNQFAPEHLEIMVNEPRNWLKKVKHAGAVFVGAWTPECAGDYAAGPSHVLPTGGTASMFSGLTADDFRKRSSVMTFTRADLQDVLPAIEAFARVEGFDAHARSARIRFNK